MQFKKEEDKELFYLLHPALILIFADMYNYAHEKHGVSLFITQTVSTREVDESLKRVSDSHLERRAIDIRTKNLDAFIVNDIIEYINNKSEYKKYHYLSNMQKRRLAYFHIGTAEHIHLAINSIYALDPVNKL